MIVLEILLNVYMLMLFLEFFTAFLIFGFFWLLR